MKYCTIFLKTGDFQFRKPKLKGNENYTIYVGTKCPYDSESSRKYHIAEVMNSTVLRIDDAAVLF